jgi:hypothetical protein
MSRTFQLIAKLSLHPVTAAIWLNKWDGQSDYSVQIERRYKDANGTWRSTETLDAADVPLVAQIKEMARSEIEKLMADERQPRQTED